MNSISFTQLCIFFGLLFALIVFVALFKMMELTNADEALALPSGTVRSLIAFMVFFAFVSIAMYFISAACSDPPPQVQTRQGLDKAALDEFTSSKTLATDISYTAHSDKDVTTYDVTFYLVKSTKSDDVAKQVITLLGGLLTTIVGFYFASKATAEATRAAVTAVQSGSAGSGAPPHLTSANPISVAITAIGTAKLQFSGDNLNSIKKVVFSAQGKTFNALSVTSNDTELVCTADPSMPAGTYDVTVYDGQSRSYTLSGGVTITA